MLYTEMATALISHRDCELHDMGDYHPESPLRLVAINEQLIAAGLRPHLLYFDAPLADEAHLRRAHSAAHVGHVRSQAPTRGLVYLDPDTAMSPGSWKAALRAAGAGVLGVDLVMRGEAANVFCAVRPPGHHAEQGRAMGFCVFNNIAVAARHATEAWGLTRVAIIDFDVHHGNGTEDIVAEDERVMMVGSFQHPFYPYSGDQSTAANIFNVPLPAGTRGDAFRHMVEQQWLPRLRDFAPQLLLLSAGFDAHREDPLASMELVEADYAWLTAKLMDIADASAEGRIVSMLEGGYALPALGRSVAAHIKVLAGL
jgi:acetoin utilization deacetylase AcuC-like enzyme